MLDTGKRSREKLTLLKIFEKQTQLTKHFVSSVLILMSAVMITSLNITIVVKKDWRNSVSRTYTQ